jgi:hypothetical protein
VFRKREGDILILMLYVIHGTDIEKAREKSHALFEALKEKR